jgi:hypothetical protein
MKTKLSLFLLILALSPVPFALSQTPQGLNYQAVARNASGGLIANVNLPVRMTIQSDSIGGTIFWQELHSSVITTDQGVINLVIGKGARQSTSTVATFSAIDWSVTPKFLKIEIDYSGWKTLGVSRLWSVPYSMVAGDIAGSVKKLAVEGETSVNDEALFEVKNKDGQTVFAVYNEGVRVYVSDGAKAVKGGFAVGGFGTDKAESTKYLFVGKDSVRVYLDTNPLTKKLKGGFAVGGYDLTKGTVVQDYLDVSSDSVRIYIDSNPATKKLKGGFAVGGYDMTKAKMPDYLRVTVDSTRIITADTLKGFGVGNLLSGNAESYLKLTPSNYFIGHQAGKKITSGLYNSSIGYQSGYSLGSGTSNSFIGYKAGHLNTTGNYNVFLGNLAGFSNKSGSMNTFIGFISGLHNTDGYYNTYLGDSTGYSNQSGYNNTFLGSRAGFSNIGVQNTFVGSQAGYYSTLGSYNTFMGTYAGFSNTIGYNNTIIGYSAGKNNINGIMNILLGSYAGFLNTSGGGNVMIGYNAGFSNTTGGGNTMLGGDAGHYNISGTYNLMIGVGAGYNNSSGWYNVFVGNNAGFSNSTGSHNTYIGNLAGRNCMGSYNVFIGDEAGFGELGSNKLVIDNSSIMSGYSLIYGEFDNNILKFNGKVGINIYPTHIIHLSGGAYSDGATWTNNSDRNLKENFEPVDGAMIIYLIDQLPVTKWNYKTDSPSIKHIGPVAQDFYAIFGLGNDDKSISSIDPSGIALVAIKELSRQNKSLKVQIESYELENDNLKSQLQKLQEKVDKIETLLAKALGE